MFYVKGILVEPLDVEKAIKFYMEKVEVEGHQDQGNLELIFKCYNTLFN